jgi:hypothetical protein
MIRHAPWTDPPYDFQIGLRVISESEWLESGDAEAGRKAGLLATDGPLVWGETDGSRAGQAEVLAMVERATGGQGDPGLPPLWAASLLCADDLCLMQQDANGQWRLTAASLTQPTFFTVPDALGKSLAEIHGPVPGFAERFGARVERMFDAVQPDVIMERRNWTVVNSADAYLPDPVPVRARLADLPLGQAGQGLSVRVERQTVRKLAGGGGVVFTIRAWRHPLADLAGDPRRKAAFTLAWRGAAADFRAYKQLSLYDAWIEAFLASN